MSQQSDSVGSSMKGSIIADSGSGRKIMSEALMGCQPRIELPSKKKPSLKDSACNFAIGIVVCCQIPSRSTNLKSTIFAPFFSAYFTASAAVMTSPSFGFLRFGNSQAPRTPDRRPCGRRSRKLSSVVWLERVFAALASPDSNRFVDRSDENLAVTDASRTGDSQDGLHHVANDVVLDDDLDPHLRDEVHHIGRASVDLLLAAGATEPFDFVDRHALHADLAESVLHIVQLEWLDDGFDFFHESTSRYR